MKVPKFCKRLAETPPTGHPTALDGTHSHRARKSQNDALTCFTGL
jgi:hypothetical protein